jgi:hypothetical protein
MRKVTIAIITCIFILSAAFLLTGILNEVQKQRQLTDKIQRLPSFSFITMDNKSFCSSEIKKGPVLIIRFHPECEHCQYEITDILKSNIPGTGLSIIMISSADRDSIRKFLNRFDFTDYPSVITLADTSDIFGEIFGCDVVPSNYIYNNELKLVKVLNGEVKTETICKYLPGSE